MTTYSKGKTKLPVTLFALLLGFVLLFNACKKEIDSVGSSFIGLRNGLGYTFTTDSAVGYTVRMDTFATHRSSYFMLGAVNDPLMGTSKAHIITQIGLPNASATFSFGDSTVKIDSAVLQIAYAATSTNFYGDSSDIQTFNVYGLKEDISFDSVYYNNRRPLFDSSSILGSYTGPLHPFDSIQLPMGVHDSELLMPHLRIRLKDDVATLLRNIDKAGNMTSTTFKQYFKGLYIKAESNPSINQGAIGYFDLYWSSLNTTTALVVYYNDSLRANFQVNIQTEARYNFHDRPNESYPAGMIQKTFQGTPQSEAYVQGGGSTKVLIKIPKLLSHIDTIAKTKLAVNGAELVVPINTAKTSTKYPAPLKLFVLASDSVGKNAYLRDQIYEGSAYYGGYFAGNQYRFNMARHIQFLFEQYKKGNIHINPNEDYITFYLIVPADNPVSAARAAIDMSGVRLNLSYTQVK